MRKVCLLLFLLIAAPSWAQEAYRTNSGSLAATGSVVVNTRGMGTAAVQLTGTLAGTLSFESTADNTNWAALRCTPPGTTTAVTSTTATGLWTCSVAGLSQIRGRVSTYTSGTFVITIAATVGGGGGSSGGGALAGDASAAKQDDQTTLLTAIDGHIDALETIFGTDTVFGTAGIADADVMTIQGIASMTPILATVTATNLDVQIGGSDTVTVTAANLDVQIGGSDTVTIASANVEDAVAGSGFNGFAQLCVRQDSQTALAADGDFYPCTINNAGEIRVAFSGAAGGTSLADDADFTDGTTAGTPVGGVAESAAPSTVTEGDFGWFAMTLNRALKVTLYNSSGTELTSGDATEDSAAPETGPLIQCEFDDGTPNSIDEDDAGKCRMSANRNVYFTIRDAAGNERGVNVNASNQLAIAGPVTVASAGIASGAIASGAVASGAYASGSIASGAFASGSIGSGAIASGAVASGAFASGAMAAGSIATGAIADMLVDDAAFTPTTSRGMPMGLQADESSPDSVDEGDFGVPRMSLDRLIYTRQLDPCSGVAKTNLVINIATATTTEITPSLAGASTNYYVCSIDLVTAAANNVALVDDNTDGCGSVTAGLAGGTTAASGWNFVAGGGLVKGNGNATVYKTVTSNSVVCLVTSAATQLSGSMQVVAAP